MALRTPEEFVRALGLESQAQTFARMDWSGFVKPSPQATPKSRMPHAMRPTQSPTPAKRVPSASATNRPRSTAQRAKRDAELPAKGANSAKSEAGGAEEDPSTSNLRKQLGLSRTRPTSTATKYISEGGVDVLEYLRRAQVQAPHAEFVSDTLVVPTMDATLTDMRTVWSRMSVIVRALADNQRFRQQGSTSLGDDAIVDENLQRLSDFEKLIETLQQDVLAHLSTIRRLERIEREKDERIRVLEKELDEVREEMLRARREPLSPSAYLSGAKRHFNDTSQQLAKSGGIQLSDPLTVEDDATQRRASIFGADVNNIVRRVSCRRRTTQPLAEGLGIGGEVTVSLVVEPALQEDETVEHFQEDCVERRLRWIDSSLFSDFAPRHDVTFLCARVAEYEKLFSRSPQLTGKAAQVFLGVSHEHITAHQGYILLEELETLIVAFNDPLSAVSCAIHIQYALTKSAEWPPFLDDCVETAAVREENAKSSRGSDPVSYLWKGLRISMGLYQSHNALSEKDLCTHRMHYYGRDARMARHIQELSIGGMVLVPNELRDVIETHAVVLEDPVVTFHEWRTLPGETKPTKLWRVMYRTHGARNSDFIAEHFRRLAPAVARAVTDESNPPSCLEHPEPGDAMSLTKIIGPSPAFVEEPPRQVSSGDHTLVLCVLPQYDEMLLQADETAVTNYFRKAFKLLRECVPPTVECTEVNCGKSSVLFAFSDAIAGVKYALDLQVRWVQTAWPDFYEVQGLIKPRFFDSKLMYNGPSLATHIHMVKCRAVKDLFVGPNSKAIDGFLTGPELQVLDTMSGALKTSGVCVTELVYAFLFSRKSDVGDPVVEPAGLIEVAGRSPPVSLFLLIPRLLRSRVFLDHGVSESGSPPALRHAVAGYLSSLDATPILPSVASLAASSVVTNPAVQSAIAQLFFARQSNVAFFQRLHRFLVESARKWRSDDVRQTLESTEAAMMFEHDHGMPCVAPASQISLPLFLLKEYASEAAASASRLGFATPRKNVDGSPRDPSGLCGEQITTKAPGEGANIDLSAELSHFDEERKFLMAKSRKASAELLITHRLVHFYFHSIEQYLLPYGDEQADKVSDDDFIIQLIHVLRSLRKAELEAVPSTSPPSENVSSAPKPKVGEQWKQLLKDTLEIDESDTSEYDIVRLCKSIIGLCGHHFLFLRTICKRIERTMQRSKAEPGSRIARVVAQVRQREKAAKEAAKNGVAPATSATVSPPVSDTSTVHESSS